MKISFGKTIAVFAAALMLACMLAGGALAEEYAAQSMRLLRYEGEVEIRDADDEPRFVMENVRFSSGESMLTGEESLASIGLDASKIVTMDQLSRVQFAQEGNQFLVTLRDGTLLLDVDKKLDDNETLDIQTSNMTVGIRGTIIALSDFPLENEAQGNGRAADTFRADSAGASQQQESAEGTAASAPDGARTAAGAGNGIQFEEVLNTEVIGQVDNRVSVLCVLEGTATVTYRDKDGVLRTQQVKAGQKAVLTDREDLADNALQLQELFLEDIEGFVTDRLTEDLPLKERVEEASDVLTKSNPVYDTEVVFTAESFSKSFDGNNLAAGSVSVEGLPEGYTYAATSAGRQDGVGSSATTVDTYAIYDEFGVNVTGRFHHIRTEEGTLTVTWDDPVTLIAQSASKMYNGEPLRRTTDVLVYGLPAEYTVRAFADGSQTDAGMSPNPVSSYTVSNAAGEDVTAYFTHIDKVDGQLVVDPAPLTVWTASAEKVYDAAPLVRHEAVITNAPGYQAGLPRWRNLSYVFSGIGEQGNDCETLYGICGVVWVHGTNPLTGETREIELHAGQKLLVYLHDEEDIQTIEFKLEEGFPKDLPEEILRLFEHNPVLMAQACADAAWDAEVLEDLVSALPELTEEEKLIARDGVLIAENEAERLMADFTNVRITIDTEITDYTDRALGRREAEYTPVYIDESITVRADGSRTETGESTNTYEIDWGNARPSNYILREELGTLKVGKLKLAIDLGSVNADYSGSVTGPSPTITYVNGAHAGESVTGTRARVMRMLAGGINPGGMAGGADMLYRFSLFTGDGADLTVSGMKSGAGTYNLDASVRFAKEAEGRYEVASMTGATMTVNPAKLTVTTGSASKVYDTTALTNAEASITGFVNGETASVTATGTITDAGEQVNTYTIDWGDTDPANYTVIEKLGTLAIEPLAIQVNMDACEEDFNEYAAEYGAFYDGAPWCYYFKTDEYGGAYAVYLNGPDSGKVLDPADISVTYVDVGEEEDEGYETATYVIPGGEAAVRLPAATDAAAHQMIPVITVTSGKAENYAFTWTDNTMVLDPMPVVIDMKGGYSTSFTNLMHLPRGVTASYGEDWEDVERTRSERVYDDSRTKLKHYYAEFNLIGTDKLELISTGPVTVGEHEFSNTLKITSGKESNYAVSFKNNTIEITPLYVSLYLTDCYYEHPVYDGTFYGADPYVGGYSWLSCKKKGDGTWDFTGSIKNTVLFTLNVEGGGKDAGEYRLTPTLSFPAEGAGEENFDIHIQDDTLYIDPAPLTIITGSADKPYDGKELTSPVISIEGLIGSETVKAWTTGTQTEIGSSENTYGIDWDDSGNTAEKSNYYIEKEELGTLEVTDEHNWEREEHGTYAIIGYPMDGPYYDSELHAGPEYIRVCSLCGEQEDDGELVLIIPKLVTTSVALEDLLVADATTLADCEGRRKDALGKAAISVDRMYRKVYSYDEDTETETYELKPLDLPKEDWEIYAAYSWEEDMSGVSVSGLMEMFDADPETAYKAKVRIAAAPYSGDSSWYGRAKFALGYLDLEGEADQFGTSVGEIEITGHRHDWQHTGSTDPYAEELDGAWYAVPGTETETCSICHLERTETVPLEPDIISLISAYETDSYDGHRYESPIVTLQSLQEAGCVTLADAPLDNYMAAVVTLPEADDPDRTHTVTVPGRFVYGSEVGGETIGELYEWITDQDEFYILFYPDNEEEFIRTYGFIIIENETNAVIPRLSSGNGDVEVSGFGAENPNHTVTARIWNLTDTGKTTLAGVDPGSTLSLTAKDARGNTVPGTFSWTGNVSGVATANAYTAQPADGWAFTFTPDDLNAYKPTTAVLRVKGPYNTYMRRGAALRGYDERATDPSDSYSAFVDINWLEYVAGRNGWTYMSQIVPEKIGFEWFYADSFSYRDRDYGHNTVSGSSSWGGIVDSYGSASTTLTGISGDTTIEYVVSRIKASGTVICSFRFTPNDTGRYNSSIGYIRFMTKWNTAFWEDYRYNVTWMMNDETLLAESLYCNSMLIPPEAEDVCYWMLNGEALTGNELTPKEDITIIGVAHDWGIPEESVDEYGTVTETSVCRHDTGHVRTKSETPIPVTITAGSLSRVYDGTELTCTDVTVEGLPEVFTCTAVTSGVQTDAGESDNTLVSYQIFRDGGDVTEQFTKVTAENGILTVKPAPLTITTGSDRKAYDGTELTQELITVAGLIDGETVTAKTTGTQTEIGSSPNTYSLDWEGGTAKESNYEIVKEELGTLTVFDPSSNEILGMMLPGGMIPADSTDEEVVPVEIIEEPEAESGNEPVTDSAAEPAAEAAAESATEPVAGPDTESEAEAMTESGTEPAAEPAEGTGTEPAAEPVTETKIDSETESGAEPEADPDTAFVTEPVAEPVTEPSEPETEQKKVDADETPKSFTGSVRVEIQNEGAVFEGDLVVFRAVVRGDASLVTVCWQKQTENPNTHAIEWKDIDTGAKLSLEANAADSGGIYRVVLLDRDRHIAAEAEFVFPDVQGRPVTPEAESEPAAEPVKDPETETPEQTASGETLAAEQESPAENPAGSEPEAQAEETAASESTAPAEDTSAAEAAAEQEAAEAAARAAEEQAAAEAEFTPDIP